MVVKPYFVFFLAYFTLHLAIPLRYRVLLIIFGSTFFYAWWKVEYTWLPFLLTALAFWTIIIEPFGRRRLDYATTLLYLVVTVVVSDMPGALTTICTWVVEMSGNASIVKPRKAQMPPATIASTAASTMTR